MTGPNCMRAVRSCRRAGAATVFEWPALPPAMPVRQRRARQSDRGVPAVGREHGASDEGRGVARQEDHARGDLLRQGEALLRSVLYPIALELGTVHRGHLRLDVTGCHRIDADVQRRPFHGEGFREFVHRCLRCVLSWMHMWTNYDVIII